VRIDPIHRRALVNGALAAAVTFVVGAGVVAAMAENEEGPPVSPSPSASGSPTPTTPPCTPVWEVEQSADLAAVSRMLLGVSAQSGSEAWAVGASGDPEAPTDVLIERWDGIAWSAEPGPNPGTQTNELRAVDVSSPNDAWAVGRQASGLGDRPLVAHFDGTEWLEVALPSDVTGVLTGVAALSAIDVWVVGYEGNPAARLERPLMLHWDGQLWVVVDLGRRAVGAGTAALLDIDAVGPDEIWAVGYLHSRPLVIRYDGRTWSRSPTEVVGVTNGIEAATAADVWAAGAPILRFDGAAWSQSANVRGGGVLLGIASVSANDVWAVGYRPGGEGTTRALVSRFDGRSWKVVEGPAVPGSEVLTGVDALPDGSVLAVGYKDVAGGRRTLAISGTTCPA
jgi:hypothetical protein